MRIHADDLGYREMYRLADFVKKISDTGIMDDVAKSFTYDLKNDIAICITESGKIITSDTQ